MKRLKGVHRQEHNPKPRCGASYPLPNQNSDGRLVWEVCYEPPHTGGLHWSRCGYFAWGSNVDYKVNLRDIARGY